MRARQRAQILELIDQAPQLARVGILGRPAVGERAGGDEKVAVLAERCLDLLEEVLREDASGKGVHRRRVVGIPHDAERRDHVADDLVLDQRAAAREAARDAGAQQPAFDVLAQTVFAVQDRVVAPRQAGAGAVRAHVVEQPRRLFVLVAKRVRHHPVGRLLVGRQLLLEDLRILRQHAAGGLEDLTRAAPILVEDDRLDVVVAPKPLEHHRVGARPCEDRLLVVAHRKEVAVRLGQALQQVVLHGVHVLKFIDQHIVPAVRDAPGERRRLGDQLVEVHHVARPEPGDVLAKQARVAVGQAVTLEAVAAEQRQQLAAAIERHLQAAENHFLVGVVGHTKAAFQAGVRRELAQQREAEGVNGPAPYVVGIATGNLLGGAVGEGDGADAVRADTARDQMLDARGEAVGLARTGSSDDEHGSHRSFDGEALIGKRSVSHRI